MVFQTISHFAKCKELSVQFIISRTTTALQIMLESLLATQESTGLGNDCTDSYDVIIPLAPIFRAYSNEMCIIIDNFKFATH